MKHLKRLALGFLPATGAFGLFTLLLVTAALFPAFVFLPMYVVACYWFGYRLDKDGGGDV